MKADVRFNDEGAITIRVSGAELQTELACEDFDTLCSLLCTSVENTTPFMQGNRFNNWFLNLQSTAIGWVDIPNGEGKPEEDDYVAWGLIDPDTKEKVEYDRVERFNLAAVGQ